ncbi:hypothetical protein [Metabacillus litoralis]|uniref:hypothetical protein n=1 Tax=Metabacillus litoralis TaxID=152268 RepID=UPI00203B12BF|nr:hypothetical protein [Metabacillus litoralis]MCM3409195.1 hypothetical protein [Metabacillus litoralis]
MKKIILSMFTVLVALTLTVNTASASSYTDAANLGEVLKTKLSSFNSTINSGDISSIDDQYDSFSNDIKKTERAIGKVSGKSNRDALNNKYVKPAKIARERVIYEVSQYRLMKVINDSLTANRVDKANSDFAKLERLEKRAVEIKEAGGYEQLPAKVSNGLSSIKSDIVDKLNELNNKNSRKNPAGIGETLLVEKDDWLDGHVKYEVELTDVISGDEALTLVKEANMYNDSPDAGMKYVLAKFRIKVLELEKEPYDINHAKFKAVSGSGVTYDDWISIAGLEPDLRNDLYEGAEHEGWTYFMVDENDEPLAVFNQGWDDEVWFDISN